MNLVRFCRENRRAIYLLTGLLMAGGFYALLQLPSNIYPELNFPRIVILVHSGDLAPDSMMISVTKPLEDAARGVVGVRRIRSRSFRGATEVSILFNSGMDMQYALQQVQARVNETQGSLPPNSEIEVDRVTPTVWPILSYVLNGDVPGADLHDYAFYNLRPLFNRVPGVARVEVQASDIREVSVIVDPQKTLSHHLSLPEIADRLRATNQVTSVGKLDQNYAQYLLLTTSQFASLEQIRNTVVAVENQAPVQLQDIATVQEGVADRRLLISGNGQPAALLNITRQIGGSIIDIAKQVKEQAVNSQSVLPPTLHLSVVYDLAEFVQDAMGSIRDAIVIGSLLAVVILFLFLRESRTTLIAATSLPLTVVGTFFVMQLMGGTLNLMSLGGLAIAIGLVIDDAVVIVENIYRHIGQGEASPLAAERGTQELLGPVIGSTITTVVVFLPLGLLKGVVGEFFSALSLTLAAAVILSLLFAVLLIPLLAQQYLSPERYRESSSSFIEPVNRAYERMVRWSLGHRGLVAGITLFSVLLAAGFFYIAKTGFLPEMDEGGFVLDYITPPGTSLAETDRIVRQMETHLKTLPEVAGFSRRTGAELGLFATEQNKGDILVKLKPRAQRAHDINFTMDAMRAWIGKNVTGADIEFTQILQDMIGDMEGTPQPIEVKLLGSDIHVLGQLAGEIGPKLQKIKGVVDFKSLQKGNPEMVFHVDALAAGRIGMTVEDVSQQIRAGLLGTVATQYREADRTIDIRVRFPDSFRTQAAGIRQFPIVTPAKQIVPLSTLARVEEVRGENQLLREDQNSMVTLTARLENLDLGSAVGQVKKVLSGTHFPLGYRYEIGGQYESQQSSFSDLLSVLALALAAVFTVLVFQFRSFGPSLIILSAAPLSLLGVFFMLDVTGTALNVSSFMGIILMVGLVVKNGIILFEYVQQLHERDGMPLGEALVQAGRIRVRPILMTTLCTLFGLLPLALGIGSGAELQKPLALAVIGGLLLSTFITLLVMPVLFSLLKEWTT